MIGSIFRIGTGIGQKKAAKKINPVWQQYQENPYAKQQLGTAQQMFNSPMAGFSEAQRGIYAAQGNTAAAIDRNAGDGTQALALKMASQGTTNDALQGLQMRNMQNKYAMLNNLNNAYGTMINEGDKVYNSVMEKYRMDVQRKDALSSAGSQNIYGGLDDITSQVLSLFGMPGMGGKK